MPIDPFIHRAKPWSAKWAVTRKQAVRQLLPASWLAGTSRIKS